MSPRSLLVILLLLAAIPPVRAIYSECYPNEGLCWFAMTLTTTRTQAIACEQVCQKKGYTKGNLCRLIDGCYTCVCFLHGSRNRPT